VGVIPGYGELADGANAFLYAMEGDWINAGLSAASLLPVLGDAVAKGGKAIIYVTKMGRHGHTVIRTVDAAGNVVTTNKLGPATRHVSDAEMQNIWRHDEAYELDLPKVRNAQDYQNEMAILDAEKSAFPGEDFRPKKEGCWAYCGEVLRQGGREDVPLDREGVKNYVRLHGTRIE
jgi:hypothetical protein